jgi:hypothetical protein
MRCTLRNAKQIAGSFSSSILWRNKYVFDSIAFSRADEPRKA